MMINDVCVWNKYTSSFLAHSLMLMMIPCDVWGSSPQVVLWGCMPWHQTWWHLDLGPCGCRRCWACCSSSSERALGPTCAAARNRRRCPKQSWTSGIPWLAVLRGRSLYPRTPVGLKNIQVASLSKKTLRSRRRACHCRPIGRMSTRFTDDIDGFLKDFNHIHPKNYPSHGKCQDSIIDP